MTFSVITPSFRQFEWLRLCASSVADQEGVELEHLVQDAGTGPELEAWAASQPKLRLVVEKDQGMYDAVNRGLRRSCGEFCAYLNCDEQYVTGALARVRKLFEDHPEIDVFFGDALVVDGEGNYNCTRHALIPSRSHTMVAGNLAILTCGTFFRRRLLEEKRLFFNTEWRAAGDAIWVMDLIRHRVKMGLCGFVTSTFTDTGANLGLDSHAEEEKARTFAMAPSWVRASRSWIILWFRLRKLLRGHYLPRRLSYDIYTMESPERRVRFEVPRSSGVWRNRLDAAGS